MEERSPLSAIVSLIFSGLPNNNLKQDENITLRGFANDSDVQNVIPWKYCPRLINIILWVVDRIYERYESYFKSLKFIKRFNRMFNTQ